MTGSLTAFVALLLTWSVLAFGGVYPWAYWPAGIVCMAIGLVGSLQPASSQTRIARRFRLPLALVIGACAVQLLPVGRSLLILISPGARYFLESNTGFTAALPTLSLLPAETAASLAWLVCVAFLFFGLVSFIDGRTAHRLSIFVVILGTGVAVFALGQGMTDVIYGFWPPMSVAAAFGPFVNRNHFAGWMVLALACSVGVFCRTLERREAPAGPGLTYRILSLAGPVGSQLLLLGLAMLTMGFSLVVSLSRSGIVSLVVLLAGTGFLVAARARRRGRRVLVVGYASVLLVICGAVVWAGAADVGTRFSEHWFHDRVTVWRAALPILRDFPITGTGLGTFGYVLPRYLHSTLEGTYFQAHNDYLQLATEGGALLAALLVLLVWRFGAEAWARLAAADYREDYWIRACALLGLLALALQETVEFSLRTPANAFLFLVCCTLAVHAAERHAT